MDPGDRVTLLLGIVNVGLGLHRLILGFPAGAISLVVGLLLLWTVWSGPRDQRKRARLMTRRKTP